MGKKYLVVFLSETRLGFQRSREVCAALVFLHMGRFLTPLALRVAFGHFANTCVDPFSEPLDGLFVFSFPPNCLEQPLYLDCTGMCFPRSRPLF